VELFHLRYFVAVAEELNFSQAARELHMSASPLSPRIRDLEHELRRRLFHRTTHTVELTPAGQALLPLARDVLGEVGSIPWRLSEVTERDTVFVGPPAGAHPDPRTRLRRLEEDARGRFDIKRWQGPATGLAEAVNQGRPALALVVLPVSDPALERLVSSGVAFSLKTLDRPSRLRAHPRGNVRLISFETFDPRLPIGLAWRRDRDLPGTDPAPLRKAALAAFDITLRHREHA
jgi:hypothetical protein